MSTGTKQRRGGVAGTHILESRGGGASAGTKQRRGGAPGTHILESRGGGASAGTKQWEEGWLALTNWRAEVGCQQAQNREKGHLALTYWRAEEVGRQQAQNRERGRWHSHPGEQRRWGISRHETVGGVAGTHILESRGGGASAGMKQWEGWLALTCWRAEEVGHQQAQNSGRGSWHSHTGEECQQAQNRGRGSWHSHTGEECQQAQNRGKDSWHSQTGGVAPHHVRMLCLHI